MPASNVSLPKFPKGYARPAAWPTHLASASASPAGLVVLSITLTNAVFRPAERVRWLPAAGMSNLVSDRDFVLRTVRVWFPNGLHVLYCTSVAADEQVEGDPGKMPCTIR